MEGGILIFVLVDGWSGRKPHAPRQTLTYLTAIMRYLTWTWDKHRHRHSGTFRRGEQQHTFGWWTRNGTRRWHCPFEMDSKPSATKKDGRPHPHIATCAGRGDWHHFRLTCMGLVFLILWIGHIDPITPLWSSQMTWAAICHSSLSPCFLRTHELSHLISFLVWAVWYSPIFLARSF